MFKSIWSRFKADDVQKDGGASALIAPVYDEHGLSYSIPKLESNGPWQQSSYLEQLEEEDFVTRLNECWLLPWDSLYQLQSDEEHAASVGLLGVMPFTCVQPQLASHGSLAENSFRIFIKGWLLEDGRELHQLDRRGPVVELDGDAKLLPQETWRLLCALKDFAREQQELPGMATNQLGWAKVRKLAKKCDAGMDEFLEKTVVLKPERLKLGLSKRMVGDTPVIELRPSFEGEPGQWTEHFDGYQSVQNTYRIAGDDGSITHVLISPEVKEVLERVRLLPGRRVAADDALAFVRNPYTVIGEAADQVVDEAEYQQEREKAGIYFHRFQIIPQLAEDGVLLRAVRIVLEPISPVPMNAVEILLTHADEFATFVHELEMKIAAGLPAGLWQGYELELSDFDLHQFQGLQELLGQWKAAEAGQQFKQVLDLSAYGARVIGIGEAERITSPFLVKDQTENWLPEAIDQEKGGGLSLEASGWQPRSQEQFFAFEHALDQAQAAAEPTVVLPWSGEVASIAQAQELYSSWKKHLKQTEQGTDADDGKDITRKYKRAVLQIELNIDDANYATARDSALLGAHQSKADLPILLRPEIELREHQLKGVSWMQHLFQLSPQHVGGCLLADDMGLGKTIQLLTFMVRYLEQNPDGHPVLVVAPVSLLDNWERELQRFFYGDELKVLKLYGAALAAVKYRKEEIPLDVRAKGISNLLRPDWVGQHRIVLTTYETLRDQEFSLARKQWAIMVCDEAQKIKNPAAMITQAAKAIPTRFRVACTGTPVENTVMDLWSLFDFIQPGLLGALNHFGKTYQRPIEAHEQRDDRALNQLRRLIEPQTLRRTKQDVAKDLPQKLEDQGCKSLKMESLQRSLYVASIDEYRERSQIQAQMEQRENGMLTLLHRLKMLCAHPYGVQPDIRLKERSPKMIWLLEQLQKISALGDKVIVFTELREVQREIQHSIEQRFDFKPTVINGDTSTNGQSANGRQRLIDRFQEKPGFSVIILSTVAVGFGVNVQAANHVIHFTRCWNPAKEDQATDRAYRIGQEKDVYVYYPTIRDAEMVTFESTLDDLLSKRRSLARDMLHGSSDISASDFASMTRSAG